MRSRLSPQLVDIRSDGVNNSSSRDALRTVPGNRRCHFYDRSLPYPAACLHTRVRLRVWKLKGKESDWWQVLFVPLWACLAYSVKLVDGCRTLSMYNKLSSVFASDSVCVQITRRCCTATPAVHLNSCNDYVMIFCLCRRRSSWLRLYKLLCNLHC